MDEFFARNRLSAFIDGELSDAEMAEVARAIEEQPEVRQSYRELLDAVELVREHGPIQAPPRFHADVMRRVEELPSTRGWFSWLPRPFGRTPMQGLGVAVVAAAVLLLVFRGPDFAERLQPDADPMASAGSEVEREAAAPGPEPQQEAQPGAATEAEPQQQEEAAPVDPAKTVGSAEDPVSTREQAPKTSAKRSSAQSKEADGSVPIEQLLKTNKGATYIPEWDKEQAPTGTTSQQPEATTDEQGSGSLATSPFSYRLTPDGPDVLRQLDVMVNRLGGSLRTTSGESFDPYILTVERNHATVVLHIPASKLESVEPYLQKMGGVVQDHADQDRLFAADAVQVTVEVLYQP